MTETLLSPVQIAPNLGAGVKVAGHWVTIAYSAVYGDQGRIRYDWEVIFPDNDSVLGSGLQSGCQGGDLTSGLASLLTFISACGESLAYAERTGRDGDNADLFDHPRMQEFCRQYGEECGNLACEIENPDGE